MVDRSSTSSTCHKTDKFRTFENLLKLLSQNGVNYEVKRGKTTREIRSKCLLTKIRPFFSCGGDISA